jgi:1,4-alpha-glucan branching enzyme
MTLLQSEDLYLFNEGTHRRLYRRMGAHVVTRDGEPGVEFSVWAPNARSVRVFGDFDQWGGDRHHLAPVEQSGVWSGFVPGIGPGQRYKFRIVSGVRDYVVDKADPFAASTELPPGTASVVHQSSHRWEDQAWMDARTERQPWAEPMSIYEVHLGSWARVPEDCNRSLTYRELAERLVPHVQRLGYTHVELMPVGEHPFYGSWGYQCTSYFAPTRRYGDPDDFRALVDAFHRAGIAVILDWVPSHFPTDEHGLCYFDGTHLYEPGDPRQQTQPDWDTYAFDYGRNEVRSFLVSSAVNWLDEFHIDGLRVDAVASMLYRDYSRPEGAWSPNQHGGRENLEAISFLQQLNHAVHAEFPGVVTIAEESTAWPKVSRPPEAGGLGFDFKWDMGWMHDTLRYLARDPIHRGHHQADLTFRSLYAFTENFVLSLSHDEVVHGKGSLRRKMPGDEWQQFAQLRLLYAYMVALPGKTLNFMGSEFGQDQEWNHETSLDWHLLEQERPRQLMHCVGDLNQLQREEPALHRVDFDPAGFEWIDASDRDHAVISFLRRCGGDRMVAALFNFTPVPRHNYRIGVPRPGTWNERFNTDAPVYGGAGHGNLGGLDTVPVPAHGHAQSLTTSLPPLGALFFTWQSE